MDSFTITEAKERLEDLLKRASNGEDVRISDPVLGTVKLAAVPADGFVPLKPDRRIGRLKGKLVVPARLMEPMDEQELRDWYGDDA
jgi:antitoxin (DNA-binding transcriptional repressor) of toxin-antitoxin stability system